ncbi:hypothetical protein M2372_003871 [Chryseobacterium sp. BIGb0232]|nr:hypothetical protein [Chryseobacterium sp. BIGb0232]ROS14466.1 hypothetical protein EDF65_3241 [Chryseobacterium nakagawai]
MTITPVSEGIHELISSTASIDNNKDKVLPYLQREIMAVPLMGCVKNAKNPLFGTDNIIMMKVLSRII